MISSLQVLENTISVICNPLAHPQDRNLADEMLQNWQNSNDAIPLSLESIASSPNKQLVIIATLSVIYRLTKTPEVFDLFIIQNLFAACLQRLHSELNQPDTPCETNTIRVLANIALLYPQYFESYRNLTPHELLIFLDSIFFQANKIECALSDFAFLKIQQFIPIVVEVLKVTDIDQTWFSLHKYAICSTPEFPIFEPLLPRIQAASHNYRLLPGLLSLYESVLQFEAMNLVNEQLFYITKFMNIMFTCSTSLLKISASQVGALQYASFIWSNTLEYGMDFFGQQILLRFSVIVFQEFMRIFRKFVFDIDEFFLLLEIVTNLFGTAFHTNPAVFGNFLPTLLNFILSVVDVDPNFMEHRMEVCIRDLTSWSPLDLQCVIERRMENPTPGLFFVVSFFCKPLRSPLVVPLAQRLNSSCPTLFVFVKRCCKLSQELAPFFLKIVCDAYPTSPIEGAETLCILSKYYPNLFLDNIQNIIPQIIQTLGSAPIDVSKSLFATLFAILPRIPLVDDQMSLILNHIGSAYVDAIMKYSNLGIDNIYLYQDFLIETIKGTANVELAPIFVSFFGSLFTHIVDSISIFWMNENDQVQEFVSSILEAALERKWVSDKAKVMMWICMMLQKQPVPGHLRVLRYLIDLLPIPEVLSFLQSMSTFEEPQLLVDSIKFFQCILLEKPDLFFSTFDLDFLFSPLKSIDVHIIEATLELLNNILQFPQSQNSAEVIMKTAIQGMFSMFSMNTIPYVIKILKSVAFSHFNPEVVVNAIISQTGMKTKEMQIFAQTFVNPHSDEKVLGDLLRRMVYLHKQASTPASS